MGSTSSSGGNATRAHGDVRLAPGSLVADRFEIESFAGGGGMGTVYRARDRLTGAVCALKVLRGAGGDQERFQREAEVLESVRHPHVVGYVAHGTTGDGDPYLAMDWLDGEVLKDVLATRRLSPREAAHLGEAVASALSAAHAKGIVHRDLKPSNLVVGGIDGRGIESVKVLDFGVARLRDLDRDLTRTGQVIGTPGYMAPEQARGEKGVDERADLFSLGCVLYRAIVGQPAFDGDDVLAVLTLLVLHDPPRVGELVDGVPDALDELVARLLEKDRARRPESAAVVSAELAKIAALPDSAYERVARGARSRAAPGSTLPVQRRGEKGDGSVGGTLPDLAGRVPPVAGEGSSSAVRGATLASAPPRRSRLVFGVAAGAVVAGGAITLAVLIEKGDEPKRREVATASASASSFAVAPRPRPIEELAKDLAATCEAWGPILIRMRDTTNAFGLEAQRAPGGWESGQAVTGWATAARACGFEGADRLPDALGAIDKLKRAGGWGSSDAKFPSEATSGATAWVLLGLVAANRNSTSSDLQGRAAEARRMLESLQNPSGTFRFRSGSAPGTEEDYSTMLGAWALVESEWLAPAAGGGPTDARRRAVGALRGYLTSGGGDPRVDTIAGYEEQTAYVILRDRHRGGERPAEDAALFEKVAKDLLERCASASSAPAEIACADDDLSAGSYLEPANGRRYFKTFWLPWATLLAYELARDTTVELAADTRARVEGVARWAIARLGAANPAGMTAIYKVAEYVFAASTLSLGGKPQADPTLALPPSASAPPPTQAVHPDLEPFGIPAPPRQPPGGGRDPTPHFL